MPSIKIQMKNNGQELYDWKNLVQKDIKAEGKANLMPLSMLKEID